MRGTMLWFNEDEHHGLIRTEADETVEVARSDFANGAPEGRCRGLPVEFRIVGDGDQRRAESVVLLPPPERGRARPRHSRH